MPIPKTTIKEYTSTVMISTEDNLVDKGLLDDAKKAIKDIFDQDSTNKIVDFESGPRSLFIKFENQQMADNALKILKKKENKPHPQFKKYQTVKFGGNK